MPNPTPRPAVATPALLAAALALAAGALSGCQGHVAAAGAEGTAASTATTAPASTTVPAALSTTTTAAPAPTTIVEHVPPAAVIDAGPAGLRGGARGPAVQALEQRLADLRFDVGKVDGFYYLPLTMAVQAFQKQQGMPRTGKADPATLAKLATADLGTAFVPTGEATRVEVDLPHQIAQFWKDGKLVRVLPVSTGSGAHYCVPADKGGGCDVAITPGGSYRADRKIVGDRESKLGHLYDPVYFNGGIALHGEPAVPSVPASHGCVRVPMWESKWVFANVDIGEAVYVTGGKVAPAPFSTDATVDPVQDGDLAPAADAATGDATTTTVAPTTTAAPATTAPPTTRRRTTTTKAPTTTAKPTTSTAKPTTTTVKPTTTTKKA